MNARKPSAAERELARPPTTAEEKFVDQLILLAEECSTEVLSLISGEIEEIPLQRAEDLRARIAQIIQSSLVEMMVAAEQSPYAKRKRARANGRKKGAVPSTKSKKRVVLELARAIDAKTPRLPLNEIARRLTKKLPEMNYDTTRRYLVGFRGKRN